MSGALFASFLIWYVVFVFSTTAHEAAHALAAYLGGDRTAYEGGQVTLDPMPHIRRPQDQPHGGRVPHVRAVLHHPALGWFAVLAVFVLRLRVPHRGRSGR